MKLPALAIAVIAAAAGIAACSSASTPAARPASQAATRAATRAAAPPAVCKLKTTFDYIERTTQPGLQAQAIEVGNVDLSACADTLTTFQAEAGQADGECTTIALASRNPGYDANATPARPLRHVIMSAGPGC